MSGRALDSTTKGHDTMDAYETLTDSTTGITARVMVDEYPENPRGMGDCFAASLTQLSDRFHQPDDMHDERVITAWERGAWEWRPDGVRVTGRHYAHDTELVERYARAFLGALAVAWWDDPRGDSRIFGYVSAERAAELGVTDAEQALRAELAEYVAWCEGDVYVVSIETADGDTLECVGGYYGTDYAIDTAREMLADAVADMHAKRAEMFRALVNA